MLPKAYGIAVRQIQIEPPIPDPGYIIDIV